MSTRVARGTITLLIVLQLATVAAGEEISVETPVGDHVLMSGETRNYTLIARTEPRNLTVSAAASPDIGQFVSVDRMERHIPGATAFTVRVTAPNVTAERVITGAIMVSGGGTTERVPLRLRVLPEDRLVIDVSARFVSNPITVSGTPTVHTTITPSRSITSANVTLAYVMREAETGAIVARRVDHYRVNGSRSFTVPVGSDESVGAGSYYLTALLTHGNVTRTSIATLSITNPFWTPLRVRAVVFLVVITALFAGAYRGYRWYQRRQREQARYVFPVDYNKLPEEDEDHYWMGRIAETSKDAYIEPKDLTTHAIVAGSTGAGKSVSASLIVEEALEHDVPVVVFDPTAQWTGFVQECVDRDVLEHYDRFGLDPDEDTKRYPGIIKKLDEYDSYVDFEELMEPGEITVFTLDHLTTDEFDKVVRSIIDSIFAVEWEESTELELLVVFDEVHRLLEKYGGSGGYRALERGAREFRKWGIGLVMASQVTADFKEAVSGNIMTEVQMQTKSMEDIERIKTKYGEEFARRVSSEEVGTGMMQHPEYNDGEPWFVDFRPPYHNPHKIPDEDLEQYHELSATADRIREEIDEREEAGEDVYDERLELGLAMDKLKQGRFNMAEMYLEGLEDRLFAD